MRRIVVVGAGPAGLLPRGIRQRSAMGSSPKKLTKVWHVAEGCGLVSLDGTVFSNPLPTLGSTIAP